MIPNLFLKDYSEDSLDRPANISLWFVKVFARAHLKMMSIFQGIP